MRANELNEDGPNLGTRIFKSLGQKLSNIGGGPLGQLAKKNQQTQQHVINDIIQRAQMNLEQGIQSGLISPNDIPSPGGQVATPPATTQQAPNPVQTPPPPAASTVPPTPEQIRKQKQAQAAMAAQQQMKPVPRPVQTPPPPAASRVNVDNIYDAPPKSPQQKPAKPSDVIDVDARQVNDPRTPRLSAPQNPSNPNAPRLGFKESSLDEAQAQYTISSYLQGFLKQYLPGVDTGTLKSFCDDVQSTYKQDKGAAALQKLGSAAFSMYSAADRENQASKAAQTATAKLRTPTVGSTANTNKPATLAGARNVISKLGPKNKAAIYNDLKQEFAGKEPRARKVQTQVPPTTPSPTDTVEKAKKVRARKQSPVVAESKSYKVWGKK